MKIEHRFRCMSFDEWFNDFAGLNRPFRFDCYRDGPDKLAIGLFRVAPKRLFGIFTKKDWVGRIDIGNDDTTIWINHPATASEFLGIAKPIIMKWEELGGNEIVIRIKDLQTVPAGKENFKSNW